MFEIPVGVNKCWNARDTFKNKGSLLFRFKFLIKNAGYRGSLIILLTQGLFLSATLWDFHNRAVYTRENKPWLTLAAAYIRCKRNHLYEYGLY